MRHYKVRDLMTTAPVTVTPATLIKDLAGIEMAAQRRDIVERGLALKKAGNAIMEAVGGRAIHPVNVRVGGFYRVHLRPMDPA